MDYATVTVIEDEILIVGTAQQGPPGAQGPQGPSGSAEVYIAASAISGHIVVTLERVYYNILGQLVETLINNEQLSAGTKEVTFNGSTLTSGIYFYTLTSENGVS